MKVDQRGLIQTSTGTEGPVRLTLEDEDDVWMLVSLLTIGDSLKAVTTRKVAVGSGSEMDRKKLSMAIKITKIDYEFGAQSAIRVSGTNLTESEWVMLGQFHTHIVSVGSDVTLTKSDWDSQHLATLATLAEQQCSGDLAVVLLQEGIANILLVGSARTVLVAKVNKAIVKKRRAARGAIGSKAVKAPGGVGDHEKSVAGFFESILRAIVVSTRLGPPRNEQDKRTLVRAVVLASPGYWKDDLMKSVPSPPRPADKPTPNPCPTLSSHLSLSLSLTLYLYLPAPPHQVHFLARHRRRRGRGHQGPRRIEERVRPRLRHCRVPPQRPRGARRPRRARARGGHPRVAPHGSSAAVP